VTAIARMFVALLFALFVLVGLSLAGSWTAGHRAASKATVEFTANSSSAHAADKGKQTTQDSGNRTLRDWTMAAEGISLMLCGALLGIGLRIRSQATNESKRNEATERALNRERNALEEQIEDRTRDLSQEVEELRRTEEMNRGQKQVLEMLAAPGELETEDILRHLTETVAAQHSSWKCALHLVARGGKALQLVANSDVNENLKNYMDSIGAGFPDAPETLACTTGQIHIVEHLDELQQPWSETLVANGILSAWSVPFRINASSNVAGALTVYSSSPDKPTARQLEMVETAARTADVVIEHRRIHSELIRNAYQDALTGLPNRRAGEQAIESAMKLASLRGGSVAVLWIDINRFKRINDQYGHDAGDKVLRTIADRLRRHPLTAGNVARMGEDEFLVLVHGQSDSLDPVEISRRLGTLIAKAVHAASALICVNASMGICAYPQDGASVDSLERNATFALYRAKSTGAAYCVFSLAMSEEASEAQEIEEALNCAIEKNYLRLVYQPLYSQGGELTGFEALLRLQHPRLGNIPPNRFIPIAEETRLIVPIGNWVLREACRQLRAWHEAGHRRVHMAVNISALQFARDDFADSVARIFTECNLAPEHLILELTESVVMEDYDIVVRQMNLLKQCGVRIAMDDFGTGYSSLSYIQRIPIDVLKIDRSFIERLADPEGTRPIVEAVIAMARHLGLQVVAEGVETAEQQDILQQAVAIHFRDFSLHGRCRRKKPRTVLRQAAPHHLPTQACTLRLQLWP